MCRRPLGGGLVELRHGPKAEHSSRWLQVSHTFQPSVPRLDVQLDQTTVSLAFNLEGDAPTQQQVYAFLPLRSYGLCFIVQVSPLTALMLILQSSLLNLHADSTLQLRCCVIVTTAAVYCSCLLSLLPSGICCG